MKTKIIIIIGIITLIILNIGCITKMAEGDDVDAQGIQDGQLLVWNTNTQKFIATDLNGNTDGGFANSTYTAEQRINGGTA